jgi:DmsE family decaheme c-type cytochrome
LNFDKAIMGKSYFTLLLVLGFIMAFWCRANNAYAETGACLDCHDTYASNLDKTSHASANKTTKIECSSCHVDYANHINEPSVNNITRPNKLTPLEALEVCSKCHFGKSESDYAHAGEHFKAGVNCSGCHKIHDAKVYGNSALVKPQITETCLNCHSKQKHQFALYSSHPVVSKGMTCVDCHDLFSKLSNPGTEKATNKTCYNCHGEMDGPFVYEHEPARDFGLEAGGCINCHTPHGSAFADLLKEPSPQLCLQCHQVPPAHRTAHDGSYASSSCVECHTDIHGSDNNSRFLSTEIISNCFDQGSGCHPRLQ